MKIKSSIKARSLTYHLRRIILDLDQTQKEDERGAFKLDKPHLNIFFTSFELDGRILFMGHSDNSNGCVNYSKAKGKEGAVNNSIGLSFF
jgi:hypothetical protein